MYQFRRDVARQEGPPNPLDVTGVNGLAQAAGIASSWIRKGIADRVEVLNRQRLVLAISRFDVRVLDEPRWQNTYQVRTLDQQHALICLGHAAHLRDALVVADEQMLSRSASVVVEIRRGRSLVARLTSADLGRVWPGRGGRTRMGDANAGLTAPS
ncbi:hypothetical protein [Streptomyces sp. DSM 40907]|uniref:hypothetical protein n=1 Tax=Streptomyces kutzneri TaxID=3051179 RepID=UPI0028D23DC4|nr:hypothetical protein [Streptomyces sp. DSM 40907]